MRFYKLLALLFPRNFRRRYEQELAATAADLLQDEGGRGRLHRARLWLGLSADAVTRGLAERRAEHGGRTHRPLAAEWRQAIRALRAKPGFAAIVIGLLGLVMGANSAVFGVVNATLLRPLPFAEPDRLVMLWEGFAPMHLDTMPWSDADYVSVRSASSFEGTAIYGSRKFVLTGQGEPTSVRAIAVEDGLFDLLGATAARGRLFTTADPDAASPTRVVLSHRAWVDWFHSADDVVGRTVLLDNEPHTVIGVLPPGVTFPPPVTFTGQMLAFEPDLYVPYVVSLAADSRSAHSGFAVARLRPGVSVSAANAEVSAIGVRVAQQFPDSNTDVTMRVAPLHGQSVETIRGVLWLLLGAVGGVLLIACASISNLLLVRASGRTREMALRTALGAGRASLVRQLLMESALLGLAGTIVGVVSAGWISRALLALNPIELPEMFRTTLDWRVLSFTMITTLAAVFAFGLVPALAGSRVDLTATLRSGTRITASPSERRMRATLVIAQVALAIVLLVGSSLMVRSLMRLWSVDPGFTPHGISAILTKLPASQYPDDTTRAAFSARWLQRVRAIPGVTAAAQTTMLPFMFDKNSSNYSIVGEAAPKTGDYQIAAYNYVSPGFADVLRVPLIEGRAFSDGDTADAPRSVVITESLARRHWKPGQAVGHQLLFQSTAGETPKTIVGVVRDMRMDGFDGEVQPTILIPMAQSPTSEFWTMVSSERPMESLAVDLRAALKDIDASLPMGTPRVLVDVMSDSVKKPRFAAVVLSAFAAVALVIAALGLYGVLAFDVSQQRREMGVRIALGATPRTIRALVVSRGVRLVAVGLAVGVIGALGCARVMAGMLFQAPDFDALALGGAVGLLALAAMLAVWLPARRATRADPIDALRAE